MLGKRKQCDVLVVGAGPVGQLAALLMAREGLRVEIVDEAWRSAGRSYAAAIHPTSLELLDDVGLIQGVLDSAHPVDAVAFYDRSDRRAEVDLSALETPFPFVAVLPQSTLESQLEAELKRRGVPIHWHHRAASFEDVGDRVAVEVEVLERASTGYAYSTTTLEIAKTFRYDVGLLIGADGQGSLVRRGLRIPFEQMGEPEEYDVFEFQSSLDLGREVRVVLNDDSANVLWTLPGGRQRWSFQVDPAVVPAQRSRVKSRLAMQIPGEASPKHTASYLRGLIEARAPWFAGEVGDIAWAGDVAFESRLARSFGAGRVWLVGDAAHQTGPIGVQSMNQGLLEAAELATAAVRIIKGGADLGLLQQYGASHRAKWQRLIAGPAVDPGSQEWVAQRAARVVRALPVSGRHFDVVAEKLGIA